MKTYIEAMTARIDQLRAADLISWNRATTPVDQVAPEPTCGEVDDIIAIRVECEAIITAMVVLGAIKEAEDAHRGWAGLVTIHPTDTCCPPPEPNEPAHRIVTHPRLGGYFRAHRLVGIFRNGVPFCMTCMPAPVHGDFPITAGEAGMHRHGVPRDTGPTCYHCTTPLLTPDELWRAREGNSIAFPNPPF